MSSAMSQLDVEKQVSLPDVLPVDSDASSGTVTANGGSSGTVSPSSNSVREKDDDDLKGRVRHFYWHIFALR
jgi:hypothetical protein